VPSINGYFPEFYDMKKKFTWNIKEMYPKGTPFRALVEKLFYMPCPPKK